MNAQETKQQVGVMVAKRSVAHLVVLALPLLWATSSLAESVVQDGVHYSAFTRADGKYWSPGDLETNPARDGEVAGTTGQGRSIEVLRARLGSGAPAGMGIAYSIKPADNGWVDAQNGDFAGSCGWIEFPGNCDTQGGVTVCQGGVAVPACNEIRAVRISLINPQPGYHIEYKVHTAGGGWRDWRRDGATAEYRSWLGLRRQVEAVQIRLIGPDPEPTDKHGMTWTKYWHDEGLGTDVVGCANCNAYAGDTDCSERLPVLCIQKAGYGDPGVTPNDYYFGWTGGQIALSSPVYGVDLDSLAAADAVCGAQFGPGWQMAEFHDGGGGWHWHAYGNVASNQRFWTYINDQPNGNCWGSAPPDEE